MEKLDTIHHICIQVANIQASVSWYQTSFNCELIEQNQREAVLAFDNVRLVLALPSIQPRHVAFVREDASTLGALRDHSMGLEVTALSDPTGNVVEIVNASSCKEPV